MKEANNLFNNKKYKILFVCLGNICRSPSAEAVMKKLVKDAGIEVGRGSDEEAGERCRNRRPFSD